MKNFRFRLKKTSKKIQKLTFLKPINESRFQVYLVSKLGNKKHSKVYYAAKIFQAASSNIYNNELNICKKLDHPNIIKLKFHQKNIPLPLSSKQIDEEFDILFYENAPYGDLLGYLIENGSFEEILARTIFHKVISGIEEMHHNGIAHLDIKPDNIVIGKNFEVKLIDFGHCKTMSNKLLKDFNVGTPSYMPPELRERTPYDGFKVDIFNLGILLFCLLAAQAPFEIADKTDFRYRFIHGKDEKGFWSLLERCCLYKIKKNFTSENIKHLIFKMISFDPEDRPSLEEIKRCAWFNEPILEKSEYFNQMHIVWSNLSKLRSTNSSN